MTSARLHRFLRTGILVLCVGAAAEASAQHFDARDIKGDYAFSFDGTVIATPPVPIAAVGRFYADGKGKLLNGSRTLAAGGEILQQVFSCTYSVLADGRGTADCDTDDSTRETFSFIVIDHGRETVFVGTTPGSVVRGNAIRQK